MNPFTPAPIKPIIDLDDLNKIDIRVGTIEEIHEIPKSKTLVKLVVNFGNQTRIILAGIKQEREDPKEVEGKQALFVVNLKPKKMMGVVSEGMVFDIGYSDQLTPVLAVPETSVPNGARAE